MICMYDNCNLLATTYGQDMKEEKNNYMFNNIYCFLLI